MLTMQIFGGVSIGCLHVMQQSQKWCLARIGSLKTATSGQDSRTSSTDFSTKFDILPDYAPFAGVLFKEEKNKGVLPHTNRASTALVH